MLEDGFIVAEQCDLATEVVTWPTTFHKGLYWVKQAVWQAWCDHLAGYVKP